MQGVMLSLPWQQSFAGEKRIMECMGEGDTTWPHTVNYLKSSCSNKQVFILFSQPLLSE